MCTKKRWTDHILVNRPWMAGWESDLITAIERPTYGIYQDNQVENRHVYYRLHEGKNRYLKVVVEFDEDNVGSVITAFPTDSPKVGEKLIWPE